MSFSIGPCEGETCLLLYGQPRTLPNYPFDDGPAHGLNPKVELSFANSLPLPRAGFKTLQCGSRLHVGEPRLHGSEISTRGVVYGWAE
jgi:hypothetical protein